MSDDRNEVMRAHQRIDELEQEVRENRKTIVVLAALAKDTAEEVINILRHIGGTLPDDNPTS